MSEFEDAMKRQFSRIWGRVDQRLAFIRSEYSRLDEADRKSFRDWVAALAAVDDPRTPLMTKVRISVTNNEGDDSETVEVSPFSLNRAIQAWENGEDYLPSKMGDM